MLEILIFLTNFINWKISILSIADWAIMVLDGIALIQGYRFQTNSQKRTAGILLVTGVALSFAVNFDKSYFDVTEFLQSVIKLAVYIFSMGLLPGFLKNKRTDIAHIISCYIILTAACAVYQHIIVFFWGRGSWPLYSLGSHFFGWPSEGSMFDSGGIMRARTFYMEPGPMAIHISMLFAILLFTQRKISIRLHLAYIVCMLSTISISGFVTAFSIYLIYFADFRNRKHIFRFFCGGIVLAGIACIICAGSSYIRNRIIRLIHLEDYSSVLRTFGTFHALTDAPWYGVGVGNHANYFRPFGQTVWYNGTGDLYNTIILAAVTMGYIGMAGFLMYQYVLLKKRLRLFFAFLITQCGWGYLFTTPGWTFLILSSVLICYSDREIQPVRKYKYKPKIRLLITGKSLMSRRDLI